MLDKEKFVIDRDVVKDFNQNKILPFCLGGFPLNIVGNELVFSISGSLCSFWSIFFLLSCLVIQVLYLQADEFKGFSYTENVVFCLDYIVLHLFIIIFVFRTIQKRKLILEIIKGLSSAKVYLKPSGILWKPKRRFISSFLLTIIVFAIKLIHPLSYGMTVGYAAYLFTFCYLVTAKVFLFGLFGWYAEFLTNCFSGLKRRTSQSYSIDELETLMMYHHLLTLASNRLNSVYSFYIAFDSLSSFMLSYVRFYIVIEYLFLGASILLILKNFFWSILLLFYSMSMIASCERIKNQAKKFDAALYRLLVYKSPARVTQNMTTLKLFFHFSGKPEVVFTLSGFLKLDWNLLYSMMAAGCAYLIVIIQLNHFI
ncbi:Gustatory receptor 152b [Halyomorpha halys]|nr:Gustatory receptor 152b [Halyomorpha halys]